ncbi:CBASS cGAMP synthase [uncultured Vagococcus sp.]|uniref:CBASS cGAMP synthase n=1 Tax=uncultured Vagococcus sp. TaxID=189676 RepID=UPI00258D1ABD|nr:CBASS cGAMP synthase [uncultured Vagococcus sp.]
MNDLSNLFKEFNEDISLSESYKQKIRTGRDAIRVKIDNFFLKENLKKPDHYTQGSYPMHTAILPLEDEDFDLDNGVYLNGYNDDQSTWPSVSTVHNLIKNAVEGHTKEVIDKNTCVRVVYQDNYHIDLPIYIMGKDDNGDEVAYLAHKTEGWIISDPRAFRDWFNTSVKETDDRQLRRVVKYLKQWSHFNDIDISGMVITILASENFSSDADDAQTLLAIITDILDKLEDKFECFKPVRPTDENLLSNYGYFQQESVLKSIKNLKDKLAESIFESENQKDSSIILRELFGASRFPLGDATKKNSEDYLETDSPEQIGKKNRHYA